MRRNKLALYVHLNWATWDRLPLITPDIERRLYRNIESEARKMGCTVCWRSMAWRITPIFWSSILRQVRFQTLSSN